MNVFIDELYDLAVHENQPEREWHAFLRRQIPSPESMRPGGGGGGGGDGDASPPEGALPSIRRRSPHSATLRKVCAARRARPPRAAAHLRPTAPAAPRAPPAAHL
eukprot:5368410-Prymnesium_polylepis.1